MLPDHSCFVTGAGGFIGGHLVRDLLDQGNEVTAVDRKPLDEWWQVHDGVANYDYTRVADIHKYQSVVNRLQSCDEVYHLAAEMGGIGFITENLVTCSQNIVDTITLLNHCRPFQRVFFSSSACAYPVGKQSRGGEVSLKESDALPADPEPGYGWEKLYAERVMEYYGQERDLRTRIARYHNVYGPHGSWRDGREKAPAALSRKVAEAVITGNHRINIWGDGEQTRSFMYIDDCVYGTQKILRSDHSSPLNLGSDEWVTMNQVVDILEQIAGVTLHRTYDRTKPQGVRGRNSDNTLISRVLDWKPSIKLIDGLEQTYRWVYDQVKAES